MREDYDDDADVDLDEDDDDEITERPTKFVRRPTHLRAKDSRGYASDGGVPVAFSCDGAPAYALLRMRRVRIKRGETVPFTIISGGFHLLLSAYKAKG